MKLCCVMALGALAGFALEPATEWAQEEFTNYTARIFGTVPKAAFVLPGETADFADDFAALKGTDGYAVRRRGETLYFIADCARGHINGVHRWLERNSDIVWPRPKDDLCFFTPTALPANWSAEYRDVPAFQMRFFGGGASDDETRRYLARNACTPYTSVTGFKGTKAERDAEIRASSQARYGMIGTFNDIFGGGHDMCRRWFPREEFFKEHPEWWMLNSGERVCPEHTNFCETNPEFVRAYCKSVEEKIKDIPSCTKILSINMEDTAYTCECANCQKPIKLPDGTTIGPEDPAFKSTRFFIFFNQVARHVAKIRPDLKILQFAYLQLVTPPKVPIEPNLIMKYCPYPRNMRQSVVEGPANRAFREALDGWLKLTPNVYWREYYFCQCIYYPRPLMDTAVIDLRYCRDRGMPYVYCDSPGGSGDSTRINREYSLFREYHEFYDMNAMEAWVTQKLFWDPSQDPEALRGEFLSRTFGPAADEMKACWKLLRDSWYADNHPSTFRDDPLASAAYYIAKRGLTEQVRACLARALVKVDLPARKAWLQTMRAVLDDWLMNAAGTNVALDLPRQTLTAAPGLDFKKEPWTLAKKLPVLRKPVEARIADISGTQVRMFVDEEAFYVGLDVRKPAPLKVIAEKNLSVGAYPQHDRVVLGFGTEKGAPTTFVFDPYGHQFAAQGWENESVGDWSVRTARRPKGWLAVARIPFATLGFSTPPTEGLRFTVAVHTAESEGDSCGWVFTLGGARPLAPSTWSRIKLQKD